MTVRDQVASVTVTETLINKGRHLLEVEYYLPIALDAAIDEMTLVVDGKEITGELLDADKARRIYDRIVRHRRDPALLEYAGLGLYRTSAFPLRPNKPAKLIVHYSQVCKKDGDLVELWYPLSTGKYSEKPVRKLEVIADIKSRVDITTVYSPTVEVDIDRRAPDHVIVEYRAKDIRPLMDFQLFYQTSNEEIGATFLSWWPDRGQDGYYMMMVSPNPQTAQTRVLPKDVVVVLDRSGSMSGKKIRQAKEAARFIFRNLNPSDRFNFIAYNDACDLCFESLHDAGIENIEIALDFLDRMRARSGTNIHEALELAMEQCAAGRQSASIGPVDIRPAFVLFLTDGLPTSGIVKESDILTNTRRTNDVGARLFAFGVGYDVNVRLLDNLVSQNSGRSSYIKPNESIESKVSSLYTKIQNPVMTGVIAEVEGFRLTEASPSELGDLFEGDQIIQVGRIYADRTTSSSGSNTRHHATTLTITGTFEGGTRTFEYPISLNLSSRNSPYRFVEKLWAVRRIGELLDEIQLHGKVEELVDELIRLSKRYGIVTPYTSFLADENTDLSDHWRIREGVRLEADELSARTTGARAQMDAAVRSKMRFMASPGAMQSQSGGAIQIGSSSVEDYEANLVKEVETIRVIGNVVLYKRGDVWKMASTTDLDLKRDADKIITIEKFSDSYFELVNQNSIEENQILSSQKESEKLLVALRGQAYLIQ